MTDGIKQILQRVSVDQIRSHIQILQGVRHPVTAPEALNQAADYIHSELSSLGCETSEHRFFEDHREYRNILGLKRGIRDPEKQILMIAHYDTEQATPGANDNASGVAAILEIARVFRPLLFETSVLFAGISLEESKWGVRSGDATSSITSFGFARGSQALAAHARKSGWNILGVINFEEIAYAGDSIPQKPLEGLPIQLPKVGNFIGVVGNEVSASLVEGFVQSILRYAIPLPCVPLVVPGNGEVFPDTRGSDHAPFWDAGYQAIMLTDTANFRTPHYHHESDTLETLNLDFTAEVCRAAVGLAIERAGFA